MLEIVFVTSSRTKLANAQYLCRDYTVRISQQKHYGVGYNEPRISDREELLSASITDALKHAKRNVGGNTRRLFFIEDTSVVISALSHEKETPGVDVKYWMQNMSFEELDALLLERGNDRSVFVRSDIILSSPDFRELERFTGNQYFRFTSTVYGNIVDREIVRATQAMYPWLDSKSFNKWFVPDGCNLPISLLSIQDAEKNDFRAGAFHQMLTFLKSLHLIDHTPVGSSGLHYKSAAPWIRHPSLFEDRTLFIVCGPTCAGKTTLATHLSQKYGYYHIEASDFMYLSYYRSHGSESDVSIGDFASRALRDDPCIVARQICDELSKIDDVPVIITGFRSKAEIECLISLCSESLDIQVIYIDTIQDTRYERSVRRARADSVQDRAAFDWRDAQQHAMGLTVLSTQLIESTIQNNDDISTFLSKFEESFERRLNSQASLTVPRYIPTTNLSLENAILLALYSVHMDKFLTTSEIAKLIIDVFKGSVIKNKNNISRYFNQYFYPYYEILNQEGKRRYKLSNTGIGRARWLINNNQSLNDVFQLY